MPFVNYTLFPVLFTMFLVYHALKQKIRCIDAPKHEFIHTEITRIWKVYLNHSKCTLSLDSFIWLSLVQPDTRLSPPLRLYCCSMIGCLFFLDIIGSQKRIATYNFHIIWPTAFWLPIININNSRGKQHYTITLWYNSNQFILINIPNIIHNFYHSPRRLMKLLILVNPF